MSPGDEAITSSGAGCHLWLTLFPTWCLPVQDLQATIVSCSWTLLTEAQAVQAWCQALAKREMWSSVSDKPLPLIAGEGRAEVLPLLEGVVMSPVRHIWFILKTEGELVSRPSSVPQLLP